MGADNDRHQARFRCRATIQAPPPANSLEHIREPAVYVRGSLRFPRRASRGTRFHVTYIGFAVSVRDL